MSDDEARTRFAATMLEVLSKVHGGPRMAEYYLRKATQVRGPIGCSPVLALVEFRSGDSAELTFDPDREGVTVSRLIPLDQLGKIGFDGIPTSVTISPKGARVTRFFGFVEPLES